MAEEKKLSKLEDLKRESRQLRGAIVEELENSLAHVSDNTAQLLKHHGTYQQDDRDRRGGERTVDNPKGKSYMFMVRTRIPGGKLTADQFLAELDLCDEYGSNTLRITTRQGLQLHGVVKRNLKATIRAINQTQLTTFAACGDVERNVMCCPAPHYGNAVHRQMQDLADRFAEHLKPRTSAYHEIWLRDEDGEKTDVTEWEPVEEPLYGESYLPRKFKIGIALPEDNCVDVLTYDLGLIAIVEQEQIVGYNVSVGGGQGVTPAVKTTFPAVAQELAFVEPDQAIPLGEAIVRVYRDFGNRSNRRLARLKYLIAEWGLDQFRAKVEQYYGAPLDKPRPIDIINADDHMGWHEQGDGRWFLGINIENGRVKDDGKLRLKTALRVILRKYEMPIRLTALQGVLLCDIDPEDRDDIDSILEEHGIQQAEDLTLVRRYSMACPAFPTCGLAVTESERVMPQVIDAIEAELVKQDLVGVRISVHMTGCPNGCARPYTPEVGLVGKAKGKYTLFLGGNTEGTRLAFKYKDIVPLEEIVGHLAPILTYYRTKRSSRESFGDFCSRKGADALAAFAESRLENAE